MLFRSGQPDLRRQQDVVAVSRMQWREFRMPVQSIGAYDPNQVLDMPSQLDDVPVGVITMRPDPWRAASLGVAPASTTPGAPPQQPLVPAVWNPWRITQFAGSYQFLDQPNEWYYDRVKGNVYLVCAPLVDPNVGHRIEIRQQVVHEGGPVRGLRHQSRGDGPLRAGIQNQRVIHAVHRQPLRPPHLAHHPSVRQHVRRRTGHPGLPEHDLHRRPGSVPG